MQGILTQEVTHGGLMTSIQQRHRNCLYLLHQMDFLN